MDKTELNITKSAVLQPDGSRSLLQREAELLTLGTAQGIGRGINASAQDLSKFGSDLCRSPAGTLGAFVENHWQEAAIGAGIAFLAPRKYLNYALLAVSGRGVAFAAYDGITAAAEQNNNFNAVKEDYASRIGGETRQFVNSLPMTFAGGLAGRSLGNAVFGKNMGAYDFASGKVSWAEVKNNLWNAYDKINPPQTRLAVFDLDGTLVATSKHLSLAMEQGYRQLSASTGLSLETVSQAMGEQIGKLKSFTNPWTVELALAERLKVGRPGGMTYEQFKTNVSDPYYRIFDDTLSKNLTVYEGAGSTLSALKGKDISVLLLTNSPASAALPRIKISGLEADIGRSVMLDNAKPPQGLAPELLKHGADRLAAVSLDNPAYATIGRGAAKPNPEFLLNLMKERNLRPSQVMVIGDSLESDMALAQRSGTRGLWAQWSKIDARYDALLNEVSQGNFPQAKTSGFPFEAKLNTLPEILHNLKPPADIAGLLKNSAGLPAWYLPLTSPRLKPAKENDAGLH